MFKNDPSYPFFLFPNEQKEQRTVLTDNQPTSSQHVPALESIIPFRILPPLRSIILPPLEPRAEAAAGDDVFLTPHTGRRGTKRTETSTPTYSLHELMYGKKSQRTLSGKQPVLPMEKLKKFNISAEDYLAYFDKLQNLGYQPDDIDRLILNRCRRPTLDKLIMEHTNLIESCREDGLNHEDLVRISARNGGNETLEAFKYCYDTLRAKGYSKEDIVNIAAHHGGAKNLLSVIAHHYCLRQLDYTLEQITKIVSRNGGSLNLKATAENHIKLLALKFSEEEIYLLARITGGSKNIYALAKHYKTLIDLGYNKEQIMVWTSKSNGHNTIERVISLHSESPSEYAFFGRTLPSICQGTLPHPSPEMTSGNTEFIDLLDGSSSVSSPF
ncbi:TAL effector repeat-containing protein [Legionella worsleiensis]|uniref:Avirulence protein AvrBs3 n=1 Tax=Legionella worsleiensis TaxID=45076 RepID=A0A0W1AL96_9GAMM|nr:TAL effector repeat-containing protein [Legionella worsleiensis]KTD82117.1 Avirulence protein AvrBs3 [Legionella worsleiensis]STY31433.1 Avirulence protein AvrBs3 [Legionella worsleiensis]